MKQAITKSLINTRSRLFAPERPGRRLLDRPGPLFAAGIVMALIHEVWRFKVGLPGHFGLIWMAGVVALRCESKECWAALLVGAGVSGGTLVFDMDGHALFKAPLYMVTGLLLDCAYRSWPGLYARAWTAGLVAGTSFLAKPLGTVLAVAALGVHAGMLRHGYVYPFVTHLCFGAVGGIIGYWLWRGTKSGRASKPS